MSKDATATQEESLALPGQKSKVTRKSMRDGIIKHVTKAFRDARNDAYRSSKGWIEAASEVVADGLFEIDEYFDNMMKLQNQIVKNGRNAVIHVKKERARVREAVLNMKSKEKGAQARGWNDALDEVALLLEDKKGGDRS